MKCFTKEKLLPFKAASESEDQTKHEVKSRKSRTDNARAGHLGILSTFWTYGRYTLAVLECPQGQSFFNIFQQCQTLSKLSPPHEERIRERERDSHYSEIA